MFLELYSKGMYQSLGKEKESCCLLFLSSTKREFRHFHVVVHTYIHKLYLSSDFSVAYIASISDPN